MTRLQRFLNRDSATALSVNSGSFKRARVSTVLMLVVWLTLVVLTSTQHELWRDEVRALSLARGADSLLDLYRRTQYDGHPFLWFLLLYSGTVLVDTPLILPILSIGVAFAAVTLFMVTAPFALWVKCLFIFSALPLYEYSVMARNYGISMLLMFLAVVLYKARKSHPWLLGVVLALLANTNVHSTILTGLFTGIWFWDEVIRKEKETESAKVLPFIIALGIILGGVALSILWTWPRQNTILTNVHRTFSTGSFVSALERSALSPQRAFYLLMPAWAGWSIGILIQLTVLGLLFRPPLFLAALGAQLTLGSFFQLAYWGGYRHQGLLLIFLISLYWLAFASDRTDRLSKTARGFLTVGFTALLILTAGNIARSGERIWRDINRDMSSSKALGDFLSNSPVYQDAMIVPEPAYLAESLPYYAPNRIYFPREGRFGTTVSWTTAASSYMSLGDLLSVARDLKARHDQPVLILYGHRARIRPVAFEKTYSYNKVFTWTPEQAAEFKASTVLVADFKEAVNDEKYEIYALKE
jgi:hypothetical protein